MRIRYYIDAHTRRPHVYRHGINEAEIEVVLRNAGDVAGKEEDEKQQFSARLG